MTARLKRICLIVRNIQEAFRRVASVQRELEAAHLRKN